MAKTLALDPQRMAVLEAALWRAYYDRKITSGLILMVRLSREQFKLSWTDLLRGAYHILRTIEIIDTSHRPALARPCWRLATRGGESAGIPAYGRAV